MNGRELADRRIVVTGASGGLGVAICAELAEAGATVVAVGRREAALDPLLSNLPGGPHEAVVLDVAREDQWRESLLRLAPDGALHGVVTAAGELGPIGPIGSWDIDSFRRTVEVNLMGTVAPVATLLAALREARGAVVTFSGGGATGPFPRYDAYSASKAAVVRLTENLASELAPEGVRVNCVAPGFVLTGIHQATLDAGPDLVGAEYYERTRRALEGGEGDPPELAAKLTRFLLSNESEGITGRLISARWDPWQDTDFRSRLRADDSLGRLRRIDDQFFRAVPPDT